MRAIWNDAALGAGIRREKIETECRKLERAAAERRKALRSLQNHRRSLVAEIPRSAGDAASLMQLGCRLDAAAAALLIDAQIVSARLAIAEKKRETAAGREKYALEMQRRETLIISLATDLIQSEEISELSYA